MDLIGVSAVQSFDQSAEEIFDAFLDRELIGQWMFGPLLREEVVLHLALDGRVGGAFSFLVKRKDQEIDHVGQYQTIDRPKLLVFSWDIGTYNANSSQVTVEILAGKEGGNDLGCTVTLTHSLPWEWADYADRTRDAWILMLKALKTVKTPMKPAELDRPR